MSYVNALTQQFVLDRIRVDDAGCWIWTMALDQEGYAILGPGALERRGHRLSYRLFVGDIPDDYRSPECRICANAARRERHARAT